MIPEYRRQLDRLSHCLSRVGRDGLDAFYQSELAKLYCVELSGLLENLIRESISNFCKLKSHPSVARHVLASADRFTNPDTRKILSVVRTFDPDWETKLIAFWEGEIKDAVGSVVGNRHLIAHGRASNVSLARVADWQKSIGRLCDFFEQDLFGAA
jgi:hypothetical protein